MAAVVQHPQHRPDRGHHRQPGARGRPHRAGEPGAYARYIKEGYFSLVALNFTDTTGLDQQIVADLHRNHHYRLIQVVPYGIEIPPVGKGTYNIWRYEPTTQPAG